MAAMGIDIEPAENGFVVNVYDKDGARDQCYVAQSDDALNAIIMSLVKGRDGKPGVFSEDDNG